MIAGTVYLKFARAYKRGYHRFAVMSEVEQNAPNSGPLPLES